MKKTSNLKYFPKPIQRSNFLIKEYKLDYEVISCVQASKAKNIHLVHELKSIILSTSNGYVAVHTSGDRKINLREIKNFLKCKEASLCSPKELFDLGLSQGTVCPIIEPTWGLHHLISRHILNLKIVSTNNGTRTGYYIFSPKILLLTKAHEVGLFSSPIFITP